MMTKFAFSIVIITFKAHQRLDTDAISQRCREKELKMQKKRRKDGKKITEGT